MSFKKSIGFMGSLLCLCLGWQSSVYAENPAAVENMSRMSSPVLEESGIELFQTENTMLPALKEGNYTEWIDRVDFPEYALDFYKLLEEAADNDGNEDFLIAPEESKLVKEVQVTGSDGVTKVAAKGIKVADVRGAGADWNQASDAIYQDYMEKYYTIRSAFDAFDRDHSEVFWLNSSHYITIPEYQYFQEVDETTGAISYVYTGEIYFLLECEENSWKIWYDKYSSSETIRETIEIINRQAEEIVRQAEGKTTAEKITYFNDWIVNHNEYNHQVAYGQIDLIEALYQLPDTFECTGALMGQTGDNGPVCESYARAFWFLCDKAEIPCVLVSGYALNSADGTGESHMWNYVQVNGNWYAVDTTWDDPLGGEEGAVSGSEHEGYLLVGANTEIALGNTSVRFIVSHPETNQIYEDGISFTNGPVLSDECYQENVQPEVTETPEITAAPEVTETPEITAVPEITETPEITAAPEGKNPVTEAFDDVYEDWYTSYVQYVYDHELMTGIRGTTLFQPDANITKAQVAQVLYNMEGQPVAENNAVFDELSDVYEVEWYADAVSWAYSTGVVTGDLEAMKFFPNDDVTREQLALMMYRYARLKNYDTSASSDFAGLTNADKVANWSEAGVRWAVGAGLISGIEKDGVKDLAPQGNATRAQVAAILQRFCEVYEI